MKYIPLFTASLFLACSSPVLSADHPHWSYEGEHDPAHWGADFHVCGDGMYQSPINITTVQHTHQKPLQLHFSQEDSLRVINNGHTIEVEDKKGDTLTVDGEAFTLQQFHFHSPSENQIDGKAFPFEGHFVHTNAQGEAVVVAVMYRLGAPNPELDKIWQQMPTEVAHENALTAHIQLRKLLPQNLSYYRYSGSLTTPPCTEGVRWMVLKHPQTVSEQQIQRFSAVMHHHNNRPPQPLHGRVVID